MIRTIDTKFNPDRNYRTENIKMLKLTHNITVGSQALQKVIIDLGSDWEDFKFVSFKGLTISGQTNNDRSILYTRATRFCSDAAGTVMVDDFIYTHNGHFMTCKDWNAGGEVGYGPVHGFATVTTSGPQYVSNTQSFQGMFNTGEAAFTSASNSTIDTHLVIKGRYLVLIYRNLEAATHTIIGSTTFLHNLNQSI